MLLFTIIQTIIYSYSQIDCLGFQVKVPCFWWIMRYHSDCGLSGIWWQAVVVSWADRLQRDSGFKGKEDDKEKNFVLSTFCPAGVKLPARRWRSSGMHIISFCSQHKKMWAQVNWVLDFWAEGYCLLCLTTVGSWFNIVSLAWHRLHTKQMNEHIEMFLWRLIRGKLAFTSESVWVQSLWYFCYAGCPWEV